MEITAPGITVTAISGDTTTTFEAKSFSMTLEPDPGDEEFRDLSLVGWGGPFEFQLETKLSPEGLRFFAPMIRDWQRARHAEARSGEPWWAMFLPHYAPSDPDA